MDNLKLKTHLNGKVQALTEPLKERKILIMPETAIAPINSDYIALTNNALDIRAFF